MRSLLNNPTPAPPQTNNACLWETEWIQESKESPNNIIHIFFFLKNNLFQQKFLQNTFETLLTMFEIKT